jgi:hypothetical protein
VPGVWFVRRGNGERAQKPVCENSVECIVYCIACGYRLNADVSLVCPECGRAFDPSDDRSYDSTPRAVPRQRLQRALNVFLILAVVVVGLATLGGYEAVRQFRGGPLGTDAQTKARIVHEFPVGLSLSEAQAKIGRLGGRNTTGPDVNGIVRFGVPTGFLNDVHVELWFDNAGMLIEIRLKSVYTG